MISNNFDKYWNEIKGFLNINEETLSLQPVELIAEMVEAVKDEDMFKLHHLGYSINSSS